MDSVSSDSVGDVIMVTVEEGTTAKLVEILRYGDEKVRHLFGVFTDMTDEEIDDEWKKMSTKNICSDGETSDDVHHPNHYTWIPNHECKDVVSHFSYNVGTAIAYLWRHSHKGTPKKDLMKAKEHIEFELERMKNEGSI